MGHDGPELVRAAGYRSVRVAVDWTACVPAGEAVDGGLLDDYACFLGRCAGQGLETVVELGSGAAPPWLGRDPWLRHDAPEHFAAWAALAAERLGTVTSMFLTFPAADRTAVGGYLLGTSPPRRRLSLAGAIRALDNLLAAHVLAADAVRHRLPSAVVALGVAPGPDYELGALAVDALLGRSRGVARPDLGPWLAERRHSWHGRVHPPAPPTAALWAARRRLAASAVPLDLALPRALSTLYASPRGHAVDTVVVDLDATPGGRRPVAARRLEGWAELDLWLTGGGSARSGAGGGTDLAAGVPPVVAAIIDHGVPVTRWWRRWSRGGATCGRGARPSWRRTRPGR
jgi:hypothetical protein